MSVITAPYLLCVAAPIKIDSEGRRWADPLWAKDLALHTDYIERLTLLSPATYSEPSSSDISLNGPPFDRIKFVTLPSPRSHIDAIRLLPKLIKTMWRTIDANEIVHTGFGFWPISEGILASPIAIAKKKFLITYVESSNWRASGPNERLYNRMRGQVLERLHQACIENADIRFFTSQSYRDQLLSAKADRFHITPASWIDEHQIIDDQVSREIWRQRSGPLRLLYAGRLTYEKGIEIFLTAARQTRNAEFSVIGEGALRAKCAESDAITLLDPVAYGPSFFKLLQDYDAVVVPSLSDEQPRIIFDAHSQGIPILGTRTGGIMQVVQDGTDGMLFDPNSDALIDVIATCKRSSLEIMGMHGRTKVQRFTHRSMHSERCRIIQFEMARSRKANAVSHD